jgi:polar amino acid transport system substrate-binding protein
MQAVQLFKAARLLLAVCAFAAAGAAHADRLADIKARGSLICATLAANEPLGFPDPATRKIVGFDVDMCEALSRQMGLKLEHKPISVEARVPELTLGRVDVVSAAFGYTKERAEQVDFTASHYQTPIKLIVPVNSGLDKVSDLADKKISAIKGSTLELFARRMLPNATVLTFQDGPTAFLALSQGKVQAMSQTQTGGIRYVNETEGKYKFAEGSLAWEPTALGVKKGEPELLDAVDDALAKLEKAGVIDALWVKWYGPGTKYNIVREKKLTPIAAFKS